jgi:hypothetical protein
MSEFTMLVFRLHEVTTRRKRAREMMIEKVYQLTPRFLSSFFCLTLIKFPFFGWRLHWAVGKKSGFFPPFSWC